MAFEIFKLVGSIMVDASDAEKSMHKAEDGAKGIAERLKDGIVQAGKWGLGITTAAASVATALGGKALKAASDFEDAFAQVTTLLSDTTDLDAYKASIVDLSNQMGVSTDEISAAVYGAISAGVDEADAVNFVAEAMKLAEGGFTDASTAVDVLTTALNAYGLSAEEAGRVSDILINTQNLGKTTVDELASSMGKVIPTANTFGVSLENLSGMYTVMTANGISTAESTTYMNSMLNEMGKSGTKASDALKRATEHIKEGGMTFSEMMDAGWELTDVLSLLDETAGETGLSMMDMFGSAEAGKAATVLWQNAEQLNASVASMGEAAGTTEEAYSKMHGTLSKQVETFKINLQNMMITLGDQLMPLANKVMDWIIEHLPEIKAFVDRAIAAVKDGIEDIKPILENLIPVVKGLFKNIVGLWEDILKPALTSILTFLAGVFTGDWKKIFEGLGGIVETVFKGLIEIVKLPINAIIGLLNTAIDGFNKIQVPDWVPLVGGKGLSIPHIPMLANGGDVTAGGAVLVGERGPELLNLPQGAKVSPLSGGGAVIDYEKLTNSVVAAIAQMLPQLQTLYRIEPDPDGIFDLVRVQSEEAAMLGRAGLTV